MKVTAFDIKIYFGDIKKEVQERLIAMGVKIDEKGNYDKQQIIKLPMPKIDIRNIIVNKNIFIEKLD